MNSVRLAKCHLVFLSLLHIPHCISTMISIYYVIPLFSSIFYCKTFCCSLHNHWFVHLVYTNFGQNGNKLTRITKKKIKEFFFHNFCVKRNLNRLPSRTTRITWTLSVNIRTRFIHRHTQCIHLCHSVLKILCILSMSNTLALRTRTSLLISMCTR